MYHKYFRFYPSRRDRTLMSAEMSVAKVIEKLPGRFVADNAAGVSAVFQFMLEDEQDFYIAVENQTCLVTRGEHQDPNVSLFMDATTMIDVINGELDGMSAFMQGRLRAEGNIMMATQLGKLFSREKQA